MPLTLGFDTSSHHVGTALVLDGTILAARFEEMARGQAEHLMPFIEGMLAGAGVDFHDLSRIGVGIGPGNFTGIRISVAAARGLAMGLGIPAIGVSTHQAIAIGNEGRLRTAIAAPREQVYLQDFEGENPLSDPALFAMSSVPAPTGNRIAGTAADQVRRNETIIPEKHAPAAAIALFAEKAPIGDPPTPLYIRPADAAPARDTGPVILDQ